MDGQAGFIRVVWDFHILIRFSTTAVVHLDVTKVTTCFDKRFSDRMHLILVPNLLVASVMLKSENSSTIQVGGRASDNLTSEPFEVKGAYHILGM